MFGSVLPISASSSATLEAKYVMALEYTEIHRNDERKLRRVWKELCYGMAVTLGNAQEAARWWRYNLVRQGSGVKCCDVG